MQEAFPYHDIVLFHDCIISFNYTKMLNEYLKHIANSNVLKLGCDLFMYSKRVPEKVAKSCSHELTI